MKNLANYSLQENQAVSEAVELLKDNYDCIDKLDGIKFLKTIIIIDLKLAIRAWETYKEDLYF